jgi:hypothetical protein
MEEDLSTSNIPVAQRRNSTIPPRLSTLRTKVRVVVEGPRFAGVPKVYGFMNEDIVAIDHTQPI